MFLVVPVLNNIKFANMITIHMQRQFVTIYPVWPYALQSCQYKYIYKYIYICIHTCIHTHTFICPYIIPWSLITIPWLGFLSLCLVALLKARLQRFLCTLALKCASWTPVNQGTSGRCACASTGLECFQSVSSSNCMGSRLLDLYKDMNPSLAFQVRSQCFL